MSEDRPLSRRELIRGRLFRTRAVDGTDEGKSGRVPAEPAPPRVAGARRNFPVHRPPGAVEESEFLANCTRCGDCIRVCPVGAIVLAPPRLRQAAGTPVIDAASQPCVMCEDMSCVTACEPGVLLPELPVRMATVRVDEQMCLAFRGLTCTVCAEHCPVPGALEIVAGRPVVDDDRCTGCGVCHHTCPAPGNAIMVLPMADRPSSPTRSADAGREADTSDGGGRP